MAVYSVYIVSSWHTSPSVCTLALKQLPAPASVGVPVYSENMYLVSLAKALPCVRVWSATLKEYVTFCMVSMLVRE